MTRLPMPVSPGEGLLGSFAAELRSLRDQAGPDALSVDDISAQEGIPRSTLYAALRGDRLPRREVVAALARSWGADEGDWLVKRSALETRLASKIASPDAYPDDRAAIRFSAESRDLLRAAGHREVHAPGTALLTEGTRQVSVLLIEEGWVRVTSTSSDGHPVMLAIRSVGDILGELGAVSGTPASATVTALTSMVVTRLATDQFKSLLAEHVRLTLDLVRYMGRLLTESESRSIELAGSSTSQRVLALLHRWATNYGEMDADGSRTIPMPLSQQDMASFLGTSRESLARALRQLREAGVVATQRGAIVLLPQPDGIP
jgi:CRP/FNR family transcriptional regulator, cyclic AMP receptor protein